MLLPALLIAASIFDPILEPAVRDQKVTTAIEQGSGALLVTLGSTSDVESVLPGATRVHAGTMHFSASCSTSVTLDGLTLSHVGRGSVDDIRSVYLAHGLTRVTRAVAFDKRSQQANVRFRSLTIAACDAIDVDVFFDISPTAATASEHGVTIVHASSVRSSAGETTLRANDPTIRIVSAGVLGSIAVNFLPVSGPLRYGRVETVARVQLTANTASDHLIRSILFTNLGDARDMDLTNIELRTRQGELLSAPAMRMRGRTVRMDMLSPFPLRRNSTIVLLLKAEIRSSRYRTVQFTLQENADLVAIPVRYR